MRLADRDTERAPSAARTLGWSFGVGLAGGTLSFAYLAALHALEHVLGPHGHGAWTQLALLVLVGVAIGQIARVLGSPGDVELLVDNIHLLEGKNELRPLRSLVPMSLLCISVGGAAGPEAPLVQTNGTLAGWFAERLRLAPVDRRALTIAGMASALAVLFGAPLGAALFALEILHRRGLQYYEALIPAVVGALVGHGVYVAATGLGITPVWHFPEVAASRPIDLVYALGAGLVGAAGAVLFTFAVVGLRRVFHRLPFPARPVSGGLVLGLLALASPYALSFGKYQVDPLLREPAVAATLAVAALAKFAGTSVTVASGWRGGFIIPLFFMGAALGRLAHVWFPGSNEAVLAACFMAALNTGVTKTPIGSTLVVCGMAGLPLVAPTSLAAMVALLLTSQVALIETQRERDALAPDPASVRD